MRVKICQKVSMVMAIALLSSISFGGCGEKTPDESTLPVINQSEQVGAESGESSKSYIDQSDVSDFSEEVSEEQSFNQDEISCGEFENVANGFIFEHNYSEITIVGYQGAANDLVIPKKINGKPVTCIGEKAFKGFRLLKSVVIPETVLAVGPYAFSNCVNLEKIIFKDGVRYIGDYAFSYCSALKELSLPESIEKIDTYAFSSCKALEKIKFPTNFEIYWTIYGRQYSNLFYEMNNIKEIICPEWLENGLTNNGTGFVTNWNLNPINESVIINGKQYPFIKAN